MENVVLSANVKRYLVNVLKGLGIREPKLNEEGRHPELSETAIVNLLDDSHTTFADIYERIKLAVLHQLQNDASATEEEVAPNLIKDETAVDRQTIKKMLPDSTASQNGKKVLVFSDGLSNQLLRNLTASGVGPGGKLPTGKVSGNIDLVIEETIKTVMAGLSDKKLSVEEKRAVSLFLNEIRYSKFKQWLKDETNQYSDKNFDLLVQGRVNESKYGSLYNQYNAENLRGEVYDQVMACFHQNKRMTETFLNGPIDEKSEVMNVLSVNSSLMERAKQFKEKRSAAGIIPVDEKTKKPVDKLIMWDVLVALGNDKTQLQAFIQTRSVEQECLLDSHPEFEVKKENKIGTLLGEQGLKHLKSQGVTVNVNHDIATIKSGKKGPWRGYKALFDRCYNYYLNDIYGPIPSIGLIQGIMSEKGTYKDSEKQNTVKKMEEPWKTDYRDMPADYKDENGVLNLAGKFYNKTKARILLDKSRISHWKYLDAKTRPAGEKEISSDKRLSYLQNRVKVAEDILANKMPKKGTADFNQKETYAKFEAQIIDKENNQDDLIQDLVDDEVDGRPFNPNAAWCAAFRNLEEVVDDETGAGYKAAREMAKDIFNLHGQFNKDKIDDDDLDEMAESFVHSNAGRRMCDWVDDNKMTVVDALAKTNNMVEFALQKGHENDAEYQQYRREVYRQEINDAAGRER